jgi:hypothetical protein
VLCESVSLVAVYALVGPSYRMEVWALEFGLNCVVGLSACMLGFRHSASRAQHTSAAEAAKA